MLSFTELPVLKSAIIQHFAGFCQTPAFHYLHAPDGRKCFLPYDLRSILTVRFLLKCKEGNNEIPTQIEILASTFQKHAASQPQLVILWQPILKHLVLLCRRLKQSLRISIMEAIFHHQDVHLFVIAAFCHFSSSSKTVKGMLSK